MAAIPTIEGARFRPGALFLVSALGAVVLAGCGSKGKSSAPTTTAPPRPTQPCPKSAGTGAAIAVRTLYPIHEWQLVSDNQTLVHGCVRLNGKPVSGARLSVEDFDLPDPTGADGGFDYTLDNTVPNRYRLFVSGVRDAKVGGRSLTPREQKELRRAQASLNVYFTLSELKAKARSGGVVVTGRATFTNSKAPPAVVLYSYRLSGKVLDGSGRPISGAVVSTKSVDGNLWTVSPRSATDGSYDSIFYPSGDADPVGFNVRVAVGDALYSIRNRELVFFAKLKSARVDFKLPRKGLLLAPVDPTTYSGAVYEGVLIGVARDGRPIRPISARWADKKGHFEFVLPPSTRGKRVSFWESQLYAFSRTPAVPGEPVDLADYPSRLAADVPSELATVTLPG